MSTENRIFPDHTVIRLRKEGGGSTARDEKFLLKHCIGTGATCVAYQAEDENGIPVRLKQFRPTNMGSPAGRLFRSAEARFQEAYRQQLSMMRDERTAAVTSGLYGLYRDDAGFLWTSVSGMVGRTLDRILPENTLRKNIEIICRIAESIKAYHEAGWLLLDVKPSNILVIDSLGMQGINFFDFDSFVPLAEVKAAAAEGRMLVLSSSEAYSAPELTGTEIDLREISPAADFYSVGALLFTAVFGRRPELFDCLPDCDYDFSALPGGAGTGYSAEERRSVSRLLHRTLTLSPTGRYETDDQLLRDLDGLLKVTDLSTPRLIRSLPHAAPAFTGRERELGEIAGALRASAAPLVLSGMGGIGKTQLALKAAETLRGEYDFYYVPFQGSVKETLLSLPIENLVRESADESGFLRRLPDDEVCQKVLSCLRGGYGENTVLIIDNFDAARDEDTPSLVYEPEFIELCSLPFRLMFTSRCRFEGIRTIPVGELEEESVIRLLRTAFPEEEESTLTEIADATGRHTLTLGVLARSAAESRGKLTAKKVLQSLRTPASSSADSVFENLKSIFRASALSRTAKSVMACAGLFPRGGLSSDLLVTLLTPEQWLTAGQLERGGWLRFDAYNSMWSVHPLVKAVCDSEKTVQPDWQNVGVFVTALQRNQKAGFYDDAGMAEKRQLEELFSVVGRKGLHKPFPWKPLCAAALLLLAVIFGFWFSKWEADPGPMLTLTLFPEESADAADLAHDGKLLRKRLKALGIRRVSYNQESGEITAQTRTSVFGDIAGLYDVIRLTLNRPGVLDASSERYGSFYIDQIDRGMIRTAEARFGSLPQVGTDERKQARLPFNQDYPYLYLELTEEGQAVIDGLRKEDHTPSFRLDADTLAYDGIHFALVLPGEAPCSWYLLDGRWGSLQVWKALASLLKQEPLNRPYTFRAELDPMAAWQEPSELPEDARGAFQRGISSIPERNVTLFYTSTSGEEISDHSFDETLLVLKRRLDCLGLPYAIGADFFDPRIIAVCLPTDALAYDTVASILPTSSVRIASSYAHDDVIFPTTYDYRSSIEQTEEGFYTLVLTATDPDYDIERIHSSTEAMLAEGDDTVYLTCDTKIKIAEAHLDAPVEDGVLVFDRLPFLGTDHITEDQLPLLDMLCEIVNSGGRLGEYCQYSLQNIWYSTPDTDFGVARNLREGAELLENVGTDFAPAEAWRNADDDDDTIRMHLHLEAVPGFAEEAAALIEELYERYDIEHSNVDGLLITVADETKFDRCRVSIAKTILDSKDHRYTASVILQGEKYLAYQEEFEQAFSSRPFYTERGFYLRPLS